MNTGKFYEFTENDSQAPAAEVVEEVVEESTEQPPMARSISLATSAEHANERLDLFIVSQIPTASRSAIQRAITNGEVTVNYQTVKPSHRLNAGESIQGKVPASNPIEAAPENIPLNIVYEDDEVIVVNKPAGIVTHPGAGATSGTLANALVFYLLQTSSPLPRRGGSSRPGIVHRLDVGTSGLIVVAKTDHAHLRLAEQFESRSVVKSYITMVYGVVKDDAGQIEAPIGRDPHNRVKMSVTTRPEAGRYALTLYRVVERFDQFTLLEVEIKTGRTHQIRVHLAHLKHPVICDPTYDRGRINMIKDVRQRAAINKLNRPFLHAAQLSFNHPATGGRLEFHAPLTEELLLFLEKVRG